MSHAIILDTYEYAKALKKANVSDAQIEVEIARDKELAKAINEIIDNNLATKHDIELVKNDLKEVKKEIIIWLGGIVIIVAGIMTTIIGHLISLISLHH
jgi:hypothetical protein